MCDLVKFHEGSVPNGREDGFEGWRTVGEIGRWTGGLGDEGGRLIGSARGTGQ